MDHLCGRFQDIFMPAPEGGPRELALLNSQYDELKGPEENPGAMGQVHHTVCFVPFELVLDVDGGLGLDDKGNEGEDEEKGRIDIFPPY